MSFSESDLRKIRENNDCWNLEHDIKVDSGFYRETRYTCIHCHRRFCEKCYGYHLRSNH